MNNPIGKLLWHKAVRDAAVINPNEQGEIIIKVPAVFHLHEDRYDYNELRKRIIRAVITHLMKTPPAPPQKGPDSSDDLGIRTVSVDCCWQSSWEAMIEVKIKTNTLDAWEWICNHKFNNDL